MDERELYRPKDLEGVQAVELRIHYRLTCLLPESLAAATPALVPEPFGFWFRLKANVEWNDQLDLWLMAACGDVQVVAPESLRAWVWGYIARLSGKYSEVPRCFELPPSWLCRLIESTQGDRITHLRTADIWDPADPSEPLKYLLQWFCPRELGVPLHVIPFYQSFPALDPVVEPFLLVEHADTKEVSAWSLEDEPRLIAGESSDPGLDAWLRSWIREKQSVLQHYWLQTGEKCLDLFWPKDADPAT